MIWITVQIELWRSESYDLPTSVRDDDLFQHVNTALTYAQDARGALSYALRRLANHLLSAGGREAHKDDVSRLVQSLGGERAYWAGLEEPFRQFLSALTSGEVRGGHETQAALDLRVDAALEAWKNELARVAADAWVLAGRSAGDGARALRAKYESEGYLMKHLNILRKGA